MYERFPSIGNRNGLSTARNKIGWMVALMDFFMKNLLLHGFDDIF